MTYASVIKMLPHRAGEEWDGESWRFTWLDSSGWTDTSDGEVNSRIKRLIINPPDIDGNTPDWAIGDVLKVVVDATDTEVYTLSAIMQIDVASDPDRPRVRFTNESTEGEGGYIGGLTNGVVYRFERQP